MRIAVRVARLDDAIAVERVFLDAAQAAWAHFIPPEGLASLSPPQRWRSETTLVSEVDGREVVGFAVLWRSQDEDADLLTGKLDLIYTAPSVWGSGVGRALMVAALDHVPCGWNSDYAGRQASIPSSAFCKCAVRWCRRSSTTGTTRCAKSSRRSSAPSTVTTCDLRFRTRRIRLSRPERAAHDVGLFCNPASVHAILSARLDRRCRRCPPGPCVQGGNGR